MNSEGGLADANSEGNFRSVIALPDGSSASDFSYSLAYAVDDDAKLIADATQAFTGFTMRQGDSDS